MTTFDFSEACVFLKMEKSTLYNLMKARLVPSIRKPHSEVAIFYREELEAWLEAGRVVAVGKHFEEAAREHENFPAGEFIDNSSVKVYHRNPVYR